MTCCVHSNLLIFCNSKCLAHTCAPQSLSSLCIFLHFDSNQHHHECGKSRLQCRSSLSWRCEYFVRVPLCLCIIMDWQRVIYNLRGESFTTRGSCSQAAAFSVDVFAFLSFFHSLIRVRRSHMQFHEHKHCKVNIINVLSLQHKFDLVK